MGEITLPSGLTGTVRKIRGAEIAAMAEETAGGSTRDGGFLSLMNSCWTETSGVGPYNFVREGDAKPDWKRILKGDILAGIVHLRQISLTNGDDFEFDWPCEECNTRGQWQVKLSDLEVVPLPASSFEAMKSGQALIAHVDGRRVAYHLATMAQEATIQRHIKQSGRSRATMVDMVAGQIHAIEGIEDGDYKLRWRWVSELSVGEIGELFSEMNAADCGIETGIEVRCRKCSWEQSVNLPLDGKRFFNTVKKRERTGERRSFGGRSFGASISKDGGDDALTSSGNSTEEAG